MPMPFHMTVEGQNQGSIEGSCEQQGREGTILCQAYEHLISIPRDTQSGLPVGKRVHHPLTVTKVFDKASPKLAQALTSGERLTVELKWYRIDPTGVEEHYFTIKLEEAISSNDVELAPLLTDFDDVGFIDASHLAVGVGEPRRRAGVAIGPRVARKRRSRRPSGAADV